MTDELVENIKLEDLPEPYDRMAEWLGLENVIKLAQELGGANVYFPKLDAVYRAIRDRALRSEFTGFNIPQLAKKYDLTENRVREILRDGSMRPRVDPNQVNLLELMGG